MTEVVSVRFKNKGKVYFFDPAGNKVNKGEDVIVETAKGLEYAECVQGNHFVEDDTLIPPLRPVIRRATEADTRCAELNRKREAEAFAVCRDKIAKHGLDMKLVDVEYNFEGNKILFFFTSDGRVDFRELVKDLAGIFKTRIELRQIGVRDEARMLGGLGICGKPFCCAQFLEYFEPVSIKMAKTQGLSLNPTKISGTCGRLMCCLKYEQDAYEELVKQVPKVDSFVDTPAGKGTIIDVNLLRSTVRVKLDEPGDSTLRSFHADEVEVLGGKAKRAEYLASRSEETPEPEVNRLEQHRLNEQRRMEQHRLAHRPKKMMLENSEYLTPDEDEAAEISEEPVEPVAESAPRQERPRRSRHRGGHGHRDDSAGQNGQQSQRQEQKQPRERSEQHSRNEQKPRPEKAQGTPRSDAKPNAPHSEKPQGAPHAENKDGKSGDGQHRSYHRSHHRGHRGGGNKPGGGTSPAPANNG